MSFIMDYIRLVRSLFITIKNHVINEDSGFYIHKTVGGGRFYFILTEGKKVVFESDIYLSEESCLEAINVLIENKVKKIIKTY